MAEEQLATDESAALQELLAAVDDWLGASPRRVGLAHDEVTLRPAGDEPKAQNAAKPRAARRPRARNTAVDMTRTLRKRAERALLEMETRDLEAQLGRMRRRSRVVAGCGRRQATELREVEADNRELRARLKRNAAVLQSITGAIKVDARTNLQARSLLTGALRMTELLERQRNLRRQRVQA